MSGTQKIQAETITSLVNLGIFGITKLVELHEARAARKAEIVEGPDGATMDDETYHAHYTRWTASARALVDAAATGINERHQGDPTG